MTDKHIPTLISLAEYAEIHGKSNAAARQHALSGKLKTARKIGHNWVIDQNEPWPKDRRIKSGRYIKDTNNTDK